MIRDRVEVIWHEGGWGYRCPHCYLFVCIPKQDKPVYCPNGCLYD